MKFHDLAAPAHKGRKRLGRGIGSGQGKTAGRGTKGQNARTGGKRRPGFEGGQNPLLKRLPKTRGFRSLNRSDQAIIHTDQLNCFKADASVNKEALCKAGLLTSVSQVVKLLHRGALTRPLKLNIDGASATARGAVEAAGGSLSKGDTN